MKTYEINKEFANHEECEKWEEENCPDRTYDGNAILMISHEETFGSPKVTLTTIMTF